MLKIGAASIIINGEIGSIVQGATVDKRAERIRDDLEANALYIDNDQEKIMVVSCDLGVIISDVVKTARKKMSEATSVPERNIIITATHTHSGPSVVRTCYTKPVDTEYYERLVNWLTELSVKAVESAQPGQIGSGTGEARIGYNRRCCWQDGTHTMHGDTRREDFIGLEGPDDPQHTVIYAIDTENNPIAVLQNNTTHTTCFYGADFFSADFPGASRKFLRDIFGNIPVLFLNGAFGDISLENQLSDKTYSESRERKMLRVAHLVTGETLRVIHEMSFTESPVIKHIYEDMQIPVRLPAPEKLSWAKDILKQVDNGTEVAIWDQLFAFGSVSLQENFGNNPVDTIPVHVIRIDDLALVTQPCELYCRFGLDIKRRSPVKNTAIVGIADGYGGYCPTIEAIMGGGYSGDPIDWTRLSQEAGYQIVDTASRLLTEIF